MTILVTGGAGYIGSHLVLALVRSGERVVVLDDLSTGHRHAVAPEARLIEGDAGDRALLGEVLRNDAIEAIFHLAGSVVVPESLADPLGYYANNTLASHALFAEAVAAGVAHVVFSSTAAVYGAARDTEVDEEAPLAPITPYGASKMMSERILFDTARAHPLTAIALRYFNVAGADPGGALGQSTAGATHLIKRAVQAALGQGAVLEIYGQDYPTRDGTCIRDYIHVSDLAEAHLAALAALRRGRTSTVYNCGYGRGVSVLEVVAAVERVTGQRLPVVRGARRAGDPPALIAKAERLRTETGWRPHHDDLDAIVAGALAWERRLSASPGLPESTGESTGGSLAHHAAIAETAV
ncbi:MAG: UDP-glucose 4-epimerase GalE [Pseudomonadota bacterium]